MIRRWLRWLASGLLSAATPLPWLVDVTSARFDDLEHRVARLEEWHRTVGYTVTLTRDVATWLTPRVETS
jgi:hypothetical protein